MDELVIEYAGPALTKGTEAADLRQVLDGFNRLVQDASQLLSGESAEVSFRILSVQSNSLDIKSVIEILAGLQPAFLAAKEIFGGITTTGEMIRAWLDIQKHLKGEAPKLVQKVGDGNAVHIVNHGGQVLIANGNVYGAFNQLDTSKNSRGFRRSVVGLGVLRREVADAGSGRVL